METILTNLESILDTLSSPTDLDGEALAFLNTRWVLSISELKDYMATGSERSDAEIPEHKRRLSELLIRLPEVQTLLNNHKSEIAGQLFSETRRVQAIRQGGYGALSGRSQLIHQRA
ncbi:MAG: hypothetical protein HQL72_09535 [Magnetococcales bacterium]|nr:hypothetical protein [Magnetococcales bacterium]